ncbi:MAG: NADH:flavin oxidoreductase/NADH oxidase [Alphaproteobacteria bacterium]|nr:NADH:flavin oxidoreductase/NADH oxidase [Alphaproteobacteria bacterium]
MTDLFSPITLGGVTLPNRVVLSPMCQYSAVEGVANDWHVIHLGRYAASGLGLIITEATHVSREGRITPGCLGLYTDAQEAALKGIVASLKRHGKSPVGTQLAHAGRKGSAEEPWRGGKALAGAEAWQTLSASALPHDTGWHVPKAMDEADIARVTREFADSAKRADRAGFDLVELHGAHGYLLHQFASPHSNKRTDKYGGSFENRMRFPLQVFDAVRAVWPKAKALGMRITGSDWTPGEGLTPEDAVALAKILKDRGCDFVDVTGGGVSMQQKIALGPGYQVPFAAEVKKRTGIPTMAVGMITDPHQAQAIVAEGRADMVALARAMLYDPLWTWHAADALGASVFTPNPYLRGRAPTAPIPREVAPQQVKGVAAR